MSHEKRPLAELMQENGKRNHSKKESQHKLLHLRLERSHNPIYRLRDKANLDLKRGFPVMPKSSCDFSL